MGYPTRKHVRLKAYDYSQNGAYFVTTNVAGGRCLLSSVVGRGLAPAETVLTDLGKIAEQQIIDLPRRYPNVVVDSYVIMPNHVHLLLIFQDSTAGASPRPTLSQVIGTFKSMTARLANLHMASCGRKFWQDSFFESILQNDTAYEAACQYIRTNPARWAQDKYFVPDFQTERR